MSVRAYTMYTWRSVLLLQNIFWEDITSFFQGPNIMPVVFYSCPKNKNLSILICTMFSLNFFFFTVGILPCSRRRDASFCWVQRKVAAILWRRPAVRGHQPQGGGFCCRGNQSQRRICCCCCCCQEKKKK